LRPRIGLRGWFRSGLCGGLRGRRFADALVDHSLGKLDPASLRREAGIGAHGADYGVAGDVRVFDFFHDEVERCAGVLNALGGETESLGVAVDRRMVSELVFLNDFVGIAPVEEVLLELGAARMVADAALTGVADDFRVGDVSASFRFAGVHQSTPFAASDNFVDVHVTSSRTRYICPTHVNRRFRAGSTVETTYGIRRTTQSCGKHRWAKQRRAMQWSLNLSILRRRHGT
jgi:hypothetical protein